MPTRPRIYVEANGLIDAAKVTIKGIESVFLSGRCLKLVESDVFVCEDARDLIWDHGISLKGADAIHVASACSANCEELLTTDEGILKHVDAIKAAVGLKVLHPAETQLLPDDYRQGQLLLTE